MAMSVNQTKRAELLKQSAKLLKDVESGKIRGTEKKFRARKKAAHLKWQAKQVSSTKAKKTSKTKIAKREFDASQGFLPNFLKSMNMVRVEELVAEKLFRTLLGTTSVQTTLTNAENEIAEDIEITFPSNRKNGNAS